MRTIKLVYEQFTDVRSGSPEKHTFEEPGDERVHGQLGAHPLCRSTVTVRPMLLFTRVTKKAAAA